MLNEERVVSFTEKSKMAPFTLFAIAAAELALADAGYSKDILDQLADSEKEQMGISLGNVVSGFEDIAKYSSTLKNRGYHNIDSGILFKIMSHSAASYVSIRLGLQGPISAVSTHCSTGAHSVGDAFRLIREGRVDLMLAGSSEAPITPFHIACYSRMNALSTKFNDSPEEASRPFDGDRDGFVMGEGAALLVLEEYNKAKARGAKIYCEVLGYGMSGDSYHMVSPRADGKGAYNAMVAALNDAQLSPEKIRYVNAHATSTPLGDAAENRAIVRLFGSNKHDLAVSSTKGGTGHLISASGSLEIAITSLALYTREVPPTLNLHRLDPPGEFPLNYVPHEAQQLSSDVKPIALSNSAGMGGSNTSVCLRAI
jgi:3-oxoacyl-[acyl-carrier-protein] synthase II